MASPVGILTRMFGTAISGAAGFAAGTAMGPALAPITQLIRNDVNAHYPYVPPEPGTLAEGVAQGQVDPTQAGEWAKMHGIGDKAFAALVDIANVGPGSGYAFDLWRRGQIDEKGFRRAVKRLGLEEEWIDDLVAIKDVRLDPAAMGNAVQQSFVPDAGLLPGPVTGPPFNIPVTQVQLDTLAEFEAHGIDPDRAKIIAELSGNPPAPTELGPMFLRGQIDKTGWDTGIREGRTKTKWGNALLYYLTHPLLTPAVEIRRYVKGWQDKQTTDDRLKLFGYTPDQVQDWYESEGRPATVRQAIIGYRRGARVQGLADSEKAYAQRAVEESDIRREWGEVEYESNLGFPSLFITNRLVTGKTITAAVGEEWLFKQGMAQEVIDAMKVSWSGVSTGPADKHGEKAQTQLWSTTHRSYIAEEIDDATATAALEAAGVDAGSVPAVLALWQQERNLTRKQLSPAKIVKALGKGDVNAATGLPWTEADALAALIARGYSQTEAQDLINIG